MQNRYTDERNSQIIISLLKAHGIKKIVASPGTTNACFVASVQNDPDFEVYSAAEERSAGYIACGLAAECKEPVVISCTGATSSRNYMPSLTEAFYRKLPILVITSSRKNAYIGHNHDQVTDRRVLPNDVAKISVQMPVVYDKESEWECVIAANKAILELKRCGGGPAHINLETTYSQNMVENYVPARAIYRYTYNDHLPKLNGQKNAILVGAHFKWSEKLTSAVDEFCEKYNAIVICDHTSNYQGKYKIFPNLATMQVYYNSVVKDVDVLIHIGDITSSVYGIQMKEVWRVNPDGEIRDTFMKLKNVFEYDESSFFEAYNLKVQCESSTSFFEACKREQDDFSFENIDIPFSNAWIASISAKKLPANSVLHLGIRNSLRVWNLFEAKNSVLGYSNTGGFGIDGILSTVIGASLADLNKIYFCVIGDLAFFYDINALGNRHIRNNVRILLVNNGMGMEMRFSFALGHKIADAIGVNDEEYIAASGHYGQKSSELVKNYACNLGFEYMSASSKEEYLDKVDYFMSEEHKNRSIIFEVFVDAKDEDEALNILSEMKVEGKSNSLKKGLRDIIGADRVREIKKMVKK